MAGTGGGVSLSPRPLRPLPPRYSRSITCSHTPTHLTGACDGGLGGDEYGGRLRRSPRLFRAVPGPAGPYALAPCAGAFEPPVTALPRYRRGTLRGGPSEARRRRAGGYNVRNSGEAMGAGSPRAFCHGIVPHAHHDRLGQISRFPRLMHVCPKGPSAPPDPHTTTFLDREFHCALFGPRVRFRLSCVPPEPVCSETERFITGVTWDRAPNIPPRWRGPPTSTPKVHVQTRTSIPENKDFGPPFAPRRPDRTGRLIFGCHSTVHPAKVRSKNSMLIAYSEGIGSPC